MYSNETSFYGFKLPEDLLDYRSHESKKRLIRCMSEGTALPFLALSSCYKPQSHPAYCGFSTLVMVLNALRVDPKRLWKTPWRWFTEELLEKSVELAELELIKKRGITMEQFQTVSDRNGVTCKLVRPSGDSDEGYEEFLSDLYHVCTGRKNRWQDHSLMNSDDNSRNINLSLSEECPSKLMAVSFHREALEQHGNGHYSPVGAFDLKTNSILVLDTARFKYPPYWVPARDLYRSMVPIDTVTGKSRGYFLMKRLDVGKMHDYIVP